MAMALSRLASVLKKIDRAIDSSKIPINNRFVCFGPSLVHRVPVCENYPEIVARIKLRDDDVCSHGRTNAETLGGLWEYDEARIIAEVTETITRHFGIRPTGWMGPALRNPE